ncbi:MAG: cobalt ECF transporter T component CbiQ [Propionibacteriaceae bacterium]|nr:cobalt ECF transporter T component CbiQ [Propionibacteriaceae bacterium]
MAAHGVALDDAAWASPWRRVRVGEKLLLGSGLLLTALIAPPWPAAPLVALACIVAVVGPARIPARRLLIGASAPLAFIVIGALTVAIRVGEPAAEAWITLGPLWLDAASVALGVHVLGRAVAGTLALLLIATTTPMVDLLTWLRRVGVPGPLVEIAGLMYRLVFVLLDTATAIVAAQVGRLGDAPAGGWAGVRRRWENLGTALGALLVRSWDRAARQSAGWDARGLGDDLVMLARRCERSTRFLAGTAVTLAGVWALVGTTWLLNGGLG